MARRRLEYGPADSSAIAGKSIRVGGREFKREGRMTRADAIIAVDGGTTNTRARLMVGDRVVETRKRSAGARDSVLSSEEKPLHRAVRDLIREVSAPLGGDRPAVIVAAGMIGSESGLKAIPHVPAPASLEDLAAGAEVVAFAEIDNLPILFIPGVRTPPGPGPEGWLDADVMRGEETETFGAMLMGLGSIAPTAGDPSAGVAYLWPGSHAKLVETDAAGRITRSFTTLGGELMAAVAGHTLVAASLPKVWPETPAKAGVDAGLRAGVSQGLARAGFLTRIAALLHVMDEPTRAGFWLGACVAADVDCLAQSAIGRSVREIRIGGRSALRSVYGDAWRARGGPAIVELSDDVSEHASAVGAAAVATVWAERFRAS